MIKNHELTFTFCHGSVYNEADELLLLSKGEYKQGFHLVWERFKRTPFLPLRYWMKVVKYFGNYIGIWKR